MNSEGSYECSCLTSFVLNLDGRSCDGKAVTLSLELIICMHSNDALYFRY